MNIERVYEYWKSIQRNHLQQIQVFLGEDQQRLGLQLLFGRALSGKNAEVVEITIAIEKRKITIEIVW